MACCNAFFSREPQQCGEGVIVGLECLFRRPQRIHFMEKLSAGAMRKSFFHDRLVYISMPLPLTHVKKLFLHTFGFDRLGPPSCVCICRIVFPASAVAEGSMSPLINPFFRPHCMCVCPSSVYNNLDGDLWTGISLRSHKTFDTKSAPV